MNMIAKLSLWLFLSVVVVAVVTALGALCCLNWPVLKFAIAVAVFFGAASYLTKPSVEYYNEARENDRIWRNLYKF